LRQIAEEQFLLQPVFDRRNSTRDLARDESFAAPRAFKGKTKCRY
jgi:hypothetical protein